MVRVHREEDYTLRLVESELAWLQALSQEANVTVQTPRLTPDGRGVVLGEARGVPKAYPITMLLSLAHRADRASEAPDGWSLRSPWAFGSRVAQAFGTMGFAR